MAYTMSSSSVAIAVSSGAIGHSARTVSITQIRPAFNNRDAARAGIKRNKKRHAVSRNASSPGSLESNSTPLLRSPPGPVPVPGLGNLLDVGLGKIGLGPEPHIRMKELSDQYGDVMSLQMGTGKLPWVVISSPEVVYEAFLKRGRDFSGRPTVPSMSVSSGKGQGFASSTVTPELKELRRAAFSHLFSAKRVSDSQSLFSQEAQALAEHLATANPPPFGQHVSELRPVIRQAVTNMVLSYALSTRVPYSTESQSGIDPTAVALKEVVQDIWEYLTDIPTTFLDLVVPSGSTEELQRVAYGKLQRLTDRRNDLLKRIIADRRAGLRRHSPSAAPGGVDDMLDAMIEVGLSDNDILYVLVDMFVAGVNTVSSSTEWLLLLTAAHPEVQRRARMDALQAARTTGPSQYVDALIMEVMRLKQPLLLPRQATVDSQLGGYAVPKGSIIYANNYALTHSKTLWRSPDSFRPERFLQEEAAALLRFQGSTPQGTQAPEADNYKFIPFSLGQRSCPGEALAVAELGALVSGLLTRVQWQPQQPWARVDLRESYSLTLQPLESQALKFSRLE